MARLSQLAADPKAARRGDIYLAVASLYQSQAPRLSDRERSLMRDILRRLTGDVEMAIRISLAERLADDDDAPAELVLLLADDNIEVARPVILRSRQLTDDDLLSLIEQADEGHQIACAERPHIGESVTAALAGKSFESVLVALLRNVTARIAPETFEALVDKSQAVAALQGPLADRKDLPAPLATRMCGWVSDALRDHIRGAYPIQAPAIEAKLQAAGEAVQDASHAGGTGMGAAKLVDKLAAAGQLRPGFLLRVLHQGQIDLFELAFARLLDVDLAQFRKISRDTDVIPLALACRAVGIDRCVFATIFNLSRQAFGQRGLLTPRESRDVEGIFESFTKSAALTRVQGAARAAP